MEDKGRDWLNDFFSFRWERRGEQRRGRGRTAQQNEHTKAYRAKRNKRKRAAHRQRVINRQRAG